MKKIFKFSIGTLFVISFAFLSHNTYAADFIIVAETDIQDAGIISQENNVIKIGFDINNRSGLQTGVKYGVKLIKETEEGSQFVVDEKMYDESLTLPENSSTHREITYEAPNNLSGEYTILLIGENESGLLLSILRIGTIDLIASVKGLEILPESCFLKVVGEESNKTYNLIQGVDIAQNEDLELTCTALSSSHDETEVLPNYETRHRTSFGEIKEHAGGDFDPITFNRGEEQIFSVILPKATSPQAYNVNFNLKNDKFESNTVSIHYVLAGISATIQNLSIDKDSYQKDEIANLVFFWSSRADTFPGNRLGSKDTKEVIHSSIIIKNSLGADCILPVNQVLDEGPKVEVSIPITSNCSNPKVTLTLSDEQGNILDQKEFKIETTSKPKDVNTTTMIIVIAILLVLVLIGIFLKRKKKDGEGFNNTAVIGMFFLMFLVGSMAFGIHKVQAVVILIVDDTIDGASNQFTITAGADKSIYSQGELITVTGTASYTQCSNATTSVYLTATLEGNMVGLINEDVTGTQKVEGSNTLTAPTSPGTYYISFNATAGTSTASIQFMITVIASVSPTVEVWVTKSSIYENEQSTVYWTSTNATYCECTYSGGLCNPSSGPTTGIQVRGKTVLGLEIKPSTTFSVSCTNSQYPI